jgi:hypothetical protein
MVGVTFIPPALSVFPNPHFVTAGSIGKVQCAIGSIQYVTQLTL